MSSFSPPLHRVGLDYDLSQLSQARMVFINRDPAIVCRDVIDSWLCRRAKDMKNCPMNVAKNFEESKVLVGRILVMMKFFWEGMVWKVRLFPSATAMEFPLCCVLYDDLTSFEMKIMCKLMNIPCPKPKHELAHSIAKTVLEGVPDTPLFFRVGNGYEEFKIAQNPVLFDDYKHVSSQEDPLFRMYHSRGNSSRLHDPTDPSQDLSSPEDVKPGVDIDLTSEDFIPKPTSTSGWSITPAGLVKMASVYTRCSETESGEVMEPSSGSSVLSSFSSPSRSRAQHSPPELFSPNTTLDINTSQSSPLQNIYPNLLHPAQNMICYYNDKSSAPYFRQSYDQNDSGISGVDGPFTPDPKPSSTSTPLNAQSPSLKRLLKYPSLSQAKKRKPTPFKTPSPSRQRSLTPTSPRPPTPLPATPLPRASFSQMVANALNAINETYDEENKENISPDSSNTRKRKPESAPTLTPEKKRKL